MPLNSKALKQKELGSFRTTVSYMHMGIYLVIERNALRKGHLWQHLNLPLDKVLY